MSKLLETAKGDSKVLTFIKKFDGMTAVLENHIVKTTILAVSMIGAIRKDDGEAFESAFHRKLNVLSIPDQLTARTLTVKWRR